jgi:hypothetical protein
VEVMKRLKDQIAYTAENTGKGAQVRIVTGNPEALGAVHEFLRFQIKDHRTKHSPLGSYRSDKNLKIQGININCGTSRAEVGNNFVPTNN